MWCEGISWSGRRHGSSCLCARGHHPEPVCSTAVDFSPLLVVGVTEVAAAGLGLGILSIITQLHPDPWCCLGKTPSWKTGIRVLTNTESDTVNQVRQACLEHVGAVLCWPCSVPFEITKWRAMCFPAPSAGEKGAWLSCEHWDLLGDGKCHFVPVKWKTWISHLKVFLYSIA